MKNLFLFIAFICYSTSVMAQNEVSEMSIKPMAGVNLSNFSNGTDGIYHMKVGLTGGAEFEYRANPWLGLSLGLMYSVQGAKIDGTVEGMIIDENGDRWITESQMDGKLKCTYLNLPLMANIYIPSLKGLAVKAGIQLGILTSDKITSDVTLAMKNLDYLKKSVALADGSHHLTQFMSFNTSMSDVCKSIDFGIPVGLSYEYRNIVLDARYYFGLTKIDKTEDPDNARNRYFSITLGYKFHL